MKNLFNSTISEIKISYINQVPKAQRRKITNSKQVYEAFSDVWENGFDHIESAYVMLLNRANEILGFKPIATGGISGTVIDPKVVFQTALKANASQVIIAHNHPSGNLQPSEADIHLTKKIKGAGEFLDLPLIDHLILTSEQYYSFADAGTI